MFSTLFGLEWRNQDSKELGYSLSYPAKWTVMSDKPDDFSVCPSEDTGIKAKTYIRVAVTPLDKVDALPALGSIREKVFSQFKEYAKSDSITTFQILATLDTEVSKIPAYYVITHGKIKGTDMYFRFTYLRHNNRLYQIIVVCPKSKFEELSTLINVAEGLFSVR
jgi:hypothetical protein